MRWSSSPENSAGVLRPERYFSNSPRPARKDSGLDRGGCQSETRSFGTQKRKPRKPRQFTMLRVSLLKDFVILQEFTDLGEEVILLVVVVRLDKFVPGERVSDEICLVLLTKAYSLMPDRVVATDNAVVQQGHMGCARGEDVGLLGLELGSGNQLHRGIRPGIGGCLRSHGEGCATEQKPNHQDGY